ncbi:hypothetical protein BV25DRAFT_1768877, partial [Artomyces pyxidatus]
PHPVTADQSAMLADWDKNELSARYLLSQCLPDSAVLRTQGAPTVEAMWALIVGKFTVKGAYAQTGMRCQFLDSRCPKNGDVQQFFDDLRTRRQELEACGVHITDVDYRSTI